MHKSTNTSDEAKVSKKIKLSKDEVIVFMGTMNAMPMMYAIELKKLGYEVIYFVDVPIKDTLSRPENHFPDINYPYPAWVVEFALPSQILLPLFPRFFATLYKWKIKRLTKKNTSCFILNGFFTSLLPYFPSGSNKVALTHGSDLDVWANIDGVEPLVKGFKERSIFKFLPKVISEILIKKIIKRQYFGYLQSDTVVYFPLGFNSAGDKIIYRLMNQGVRFVPRYDISSEPLQGQSRVFRSPAGKLQLFSGVRFLFRTFPDGNKEYSKGNDLIIKGIAKYFAVNKEIEVHFVEKGEDVQEAKELCRQLGIEQVVVWHKEMSFNNLLLLYQKSDICFDQVGAHWIGAIGGYALWLGKPLIANDEPAIRSGIWPMDNPVCSANTSEEVYLWLKRLEDGKFREKISEKSKEFVEAYMMPYKALEAIFEIEYKVF